MRLKTPLFWYKQEITLPALLLWPLSKLYELGRFFHICLSPKAYSSKIPVICIGNVTVGGSGKTPSAIALCKLIQQKRPDLKIAFVTRGYGGAIENTIFVDVHNNTAAEVGDETLLLAQHAPTIKAANRADGIKLAESYHYDLVILDDGMQNHTIEKNFTIMVVDALKYFGNQMLLPAGPLRERLNSALFKTNAIVAVGGHLKDDFAKPVINAKIKPPQSMPSQSSDGFLAFCGLAHPDKFYKTLVDNGYEIGKTKSFADHHKYSDEDLRALFKTAQKHNLSLITTEKDAVKIPQTTMQNFNICVLKIDLAFDDEDKLFELLAGELGL